MDRRLPVPAIAPWVPGLLHPDVRLAPVKTHIAGITRLRLNVAFAKIAIEILTIANSHCRRGFQSPCSPEILDKVGVQFKIRMRL